MLTIITVILFLIVFYMIYRQDEANAKKPIKDSDMLTCLIEMQQEINDIKKGMEHVINYTGDRQISNECIIKLLEARGLTKEQIVEIFDVIGI